MLAWPDQPRLYEINTWVWLDALSRREGRRLGLADVPPHEWDRLAQLGFDGVWLMGVWERSPVGAAIARDHAGLQLDFRRALPDLTPEDVVGSPYCVRRYVVDQRLGGPPGLAAARVALERHGLRLLLDWVPNHVARDHPWVLEHPEYFVRGTAEDLASAPDGFFQAGSHVLACGRDPFFPPWTDVAQLDAFCPGLRDAAEAELLALAGQCDGLRCDMAMLVLNSTFARTWGARVGPPPAEEYWPRLIGAVKAEHPGFLFVAEAYWDLESELLLQGFDLAYDKRVYDRLRGHDAPGLLRHVEQQAGHQHRLLRFLENHDEARAAEVFGREPLRAAATALFTLPGARLVHEGQLAGRHVRLPVQLGRRPDEPSETALVELHDLLLRATAEPVFRHGHWQPCERAGWPDNRSYESLVAWVWSLGAERRLAVANLSARRSQGLVRVPFPDLAERRLRLVDRLTGEAYERDGQELVGPGLFVDLPPFGAHLLELRDA